MVRENFFHRLLNLLYPRHCVLCRDFLDEATSRSGQLCVNCRKTALRPPEMSACRRCGYWQMFRTMEYDRCESCRDYALGASKVWALGNYQYPLREMILRMKHPYGDSLSQTMARLLYDEFGDALQERQFDAVIPSPMHWLRRTLRGTNSPDILGEELARLLGIPCFEHIMRRSRWAPKQTDLRWDLRHENLHKVFRVRYGFDLRGAKLLFVDDVMTTGGTSFEVTKALKKAGAKEVAAAVVARAGKI